jgi:hypothetical protein
MDNQGFCRIGRIQRGHSLRQLAARYIALFPTASISGFENLNNALVRFSFSAALGAYFMRLMCQRALSLRSVARIATQERLYARAECDWNPAVLKILRSNVHASFDFPSGKRRSREGGGLGLQRLQFKAPVMDDVVALPTSHTECIAPLDRNVRGSNELLSNRHTYIPAFDGLRGVAILPVILLHVGATTLPSGGLLYELSRGWYGVDLFFVLRGFLITWILLSEIEATGNLDLGHFYRRRFLRLAPA